MWPQTLAAIALVWYSTVCLVIAIGTIQLYRYFSKPVAKPVSPELPLECVPHVTVIRPVKGLEPCLYECLLSTYQQSYPASKLTVYFCVATRSDPSVPTLERLVEEFRGRFDTKLYVEEEDPKLHGRYGGGGSGDALGPNPKIRNMSRAYREAKGDMVWIADCNVWASASACGLMVDALCGFGSYARGRKYKFVHQLPLAVDVTNTSLHSSSSDDDDASKRRKRKTLSSFAGGLLDEMFLSTSHAKFYTAISTVAVAPCTVGKSNMFRRSHLAALTQPTPRRPDAAPGIDFFSHNICEDHLIGDLLWKSAVPASVRALAAREGLSPSSSSSSSSNSPSSNANANAIAWGHHALLPSPPCIQPLADVALGSYAARRARWLRVRKFTVPLATLVEPATESALATLLGAYGLASCQMLGVPRTSWTALAALWLLGMAGWCALDRWLWRLLQGWRSEALGSSNNGRGERETALEQTMTATIPAFVGSGVRRRSFGAWLCAWCGRELLAWPVWAWAVLGGATVDWRGRKFWVGFDMKVHAIDDDDDDDSGRGNDRGGGGSKGGKEA